ncbi:MAG: hypothetical protein ACYDCJ_12930 [Gammaproteobacteria bacterium]
MTTPTVSSGITEAHDFLPNYLYALRSLLHDPAAVYFEDADLIRYINEARQHVCMDTGCLRTLLTPTFPAGVGQFNFGGVYSISAPVPAGATPPLQLVSGGGATATADTAVVPMTAAVVLGGEYYQPPIVTFDAPGMNISATGVAELASSAGTVTQLWSNAGNGYTPVSTDLYSTSSPGYGSSNPVNAALGYGELTSGHFTPVGPWAAALAAPVPSGYGYIWYPNSLSGLSLSPANPTPQLSLTLGATNTGALTGDVYLRWFKWNPNTGIYTPILTFISPGITVTNSELTYTSWNLLSQFEVVFAAGEYLYVDVIMNITANTTGGTSSIGMGTGPTLTFGVNAVDLCKPVSAINVTSDAGQYNAAGVTPTVNIVPVGVAAEVQNDGTGNLEIITQGSGQDIGILVQDAAGILTCLGSSQFSILSKWIASVDNCTLIWNSRRAALRNMAFSDFSAALRQWVPFQNVPKAFSVYGESLWIGPVSNQAYTYELDCILYPMPLTNYTAVGQISSKNAVQAVKYFAAYLAKMSQQEVQEGSIFLQLYKESVSWASNVYTTRLSRNYQDNENLY